ncbi:MAG: ABC transporter ATP-binding protein [Candidatus Dormibacteraeota bacterium]|nr:ABC transporter ATP-binding protein [Candidatus Dormibacteraeota bacterium]
MSSAEDNGAPALRIRGITAGYGGPPIVRNVDMDVRRGQVVAMVGPNGAGKSTLLKAVLGLARVAAGRVELNGADVTALPLEKLARRGIGYVPQVDDVFDALRVRENLDMGGYLFNRSQRAERMERALDVFPQLRPRLNRYVETLSGGERKMTAIARVLMLDPSVLILDEPTASLSPELSRAVLETQVRALGDLGKAVLLVEQKAVAALSVSDWAYMLVRGEVVMSADAKEVLAKPDMREIFLGASAPPVATTGRGAV